VVSWGKRGDRSPARGKKEKIQPLSLSLSIAVVTMLYTALYAATNTGCAYAWFIGGCAYAWFIGGYANNYIPSRLRAIITSITLIAAPFIIASSKTPLVTLSVCTTAMTTVSTLDNMRNGLPLRKAFGFGIGNGTLLITGPLIGSVYALAIYRNGKPVHLFGGEVQLYCDADWGPAIKHHG